jgi:hypothetical protein
VGVSFLFIDALSTLHITYNSMRNYDMYKSGIVEDVEGNGHDLLVEIFKYIKSIGSTDFGPRLEIGTCRTRSRVPTTEQFDVR